MTYKLDPWLANIIFLPGLVTGLLCPTSHEAQAFFLMLARPTGHTIHKHNYMFHPQPIKFKLIFAFALVHTLSISLLGDTRQDLSSSQHPELFPCPGCSWYSGCWPGTATRQAPQCGALRRVRSPGYPAAGARDSVRSPVQVLVCCQSGRSAAPCWPDWRGWSRGWRPSGPGLSSLRLTWTR